MQKMPKGDENMISPDAPWWDLPKPKKIEAFLALPEREQEERILAFVQQQEQERNAKKTVPKPVHKPAATEMGD